MNFQRPPLTDNVETVRAEIAQVLTLHQAMFQKLLFERSALPLELAELFEDAANVYLGFSEAISAQHLLARTPRGERCECRATSSSRCRAERPRPRERDRVRS